MVEYSQQLGQIRINKLKLSLFGTIPSEKGWHPIWFDENENYLGWDNFYVIEHDNNGIRVERANGTEME